MNYPVPEGYYQGKRKDNGEWIEGYFYRTVKDGLELIPMIKVINKDEIDHLMCYSSEDYEIDIETLKKNHEPKRGHSYCDRCYQLHDRMRIKEDNTGIMKFKSKLLKMYFREKTDGGIPLIDKKGNRYKFLVVKCSDYISDVCFGDYTRSRSNQKYMKYDDPFIIVKGIIGEIIVITTSKTGFIENIHLENGIKII